MTSTPTLRKPTSMGEVVVDVVLDRVVEREAEAAGAGSAVPEAQAQAPPDDCLDVEHADLLEEGADRERDQQAGRADLAPGGGGHGRHGDEGAAEGLRDRAEGAALDEGQHPVAV